MTIAHVDVMPRRRSMPDLADLDADTRLAVQASVQRLRRDRDVWVERFLALTREHVAGYASLTDEEIRDSARSFIDGELSELAAFRIPDDALRGKLEAHAARRVAQGISMESLTAAYQLGSRELLTLMDAIATEVGLPPNLLLAVHDSTWEFANEASAVFARVQREHTVERARFDAERRSAFARALLTGTLPTPTIQRDAAGFGLDPTARYTAVAARVGTESTAAGDGVRRALAAALHVTGDRLLFAEVGPTLGGVLPSAPRDLSGDHLVGVSRPVALGGLGAAFEEADVALLTAERFGSRGLVHLADLGVKPLVLASPRVADALEHRLLAAVDGDRNGEELRRTARVYLACDQSAPEAGRRLVVHPNTVRYRVRRFCELTGLDLRRTEDVVAAWWLLNRGPVNRGPGQLRS